MPAVTGRCFNGHHTSTLTRVVFQQEAPRGYSPAHPHRLAPNGGSLCGMTQGTRPDLRQMFSYRFIISRFSRLSTGKIPPPTARRPWGSTASREDAGGPCPMGLFIKTIYNCQEIHTLNCVVYPYFWGRCLSGSLCVPSADSCSAICSSHENTPIISHDFSLLFIVSR